MSISLVAVVAKKKDHDIPFSRRWHAKIVVTALLVKILKSIEAQHHEILFVLWQIRHLDN